MPNNVVKKHELEISRFIKTDLETARKAADQARARLQYEGRNVDTLGAAVTAMGAYVRATKKLLKMVESHPEDFKEGFDLEQLKKLIDKL